MRFVRQRDNYSCGPVAIMNVLKWAGHPINYQDSISQLQRLCNCRPKDGKGTMHSDFDRALRKIADRLGSFKVRRVHRPALSEIEEHLQAGGLVILNYYWRKKGEGYRHFSILADVKPSGKYFLTVNDFAHGPAERIVSRKKFKNFNLRFQRVDPHYKAWFISLKD